MLTHQEQGHLRIEQNKSVVGCLTWQQSGIGSPVGPIGLPGVSQISNGECQAERNESEGQDGRTQTQHRQLSQGCLYQRHTACKRPFVMTNNDHKFRKHATFDKLFALAM